MPFVFGIVGILLVVSGVRGQSTTLFKLVKSDFTGQPNYFEWMIAIFLVGSIGYVKELSTISRMFMFIILAGLLYQNKQVFSELGPEEKAQPSTSTGAASSSASNPFTISSQLNGIPNGNGLPPLASLESIES